MIIDGSQPQVVYDELQRHFHPWDYTDQARNGLLADYAGRIKKVYTATFASGEVLGQIKERRASDCLLFTHHPRAQRREGEEPACFSGDDLEYMKERGISHFSFHIPLDQNGPYSPGVNLAAAVGATPYGGFYEQDGAVMGLLCRSPYRQAAELLAAVEAAVGHGCKLYRYGGKELADGKLGIMAGGASDASIYSYLREEGVSTFLTGVTSPSVDWIEAVHEEARQNGINLLGATHYSSEKFALIAMCRYFEERGIPAEFLEEAPILEEL